MKERRDFREQEGVKSWNEVRLVDCICNVVFKEEASGYLSPH